MSLVQWFRRFGGVLLVAIVAGGVGAQQNTERDPVPNPFRTISDVVTMPEGRVMGSSNAVDVDSQGNIWLFERCGANSCLDSDVNPILQFDPSGRLLTSFGAGMFVFPHGIIVDDDDNLWVVDAGVAEGKGNQIFKFSPEGEVLMTLGQPGVRGESPDLFNEPSDLTIAPNGDIYVADGHIAQRSNGRIVVFNNEGEFLRAWGTKGSGPGELDCPTPSPWILRAAFSSETGRTTAFRFSLRRESSSRSGHSSGARAACGSEMTSCMWRTLSPGPPRGSTATTLGGIAAFGSAA